MGYRTVGIPTPYIHSVGNRATIQQYGVVRPPLFSKLIQWTCGSPTTLDDGTVIVEDKKGDSGLADGREGVSGAYIQGDVTGPLYITIDNINLGTSHTIEFYSKLTATTGVLVGGLSSTVTVFEDSTGLVYRLGSQLADFNFTIDTTSYHEYKIVRSDLDVELFIDGVKEGTTQTLTTNTDFDVSFILNRAALDSAFTAELSTLNLNGYESDFQSGNQDTKVPFINYTTKDVFYGEIQNATGDDRVSTTNLESRMDNEGYTVARALGKNLFNKDVREDGLFIDPNTGGTGSNGSFFITGYIYIEPNTTYHQNQQGTVENYAWYDEDFVYISGGTNEFEITSPSNARYIRTTEAIIYVDDFQLELGSVETTYEAWEGYYYDQALTNPVPDGKLSQNVGGETEWYVTGGVKGTSEFTGLLQADLYYSKGSFTANGTDNYLNTGIVPNQDTVMKVWGRFNSTTGVQRFGSATNFNTSNYRIGIDSGLWSAGFGGVRINNGVADVSPHIFEFENGYFNVDKVNQVDVSAGTIGSPIYSLCLLAQNEGGTIGSFSNFTIYKAEIIHNGSTHIWDFNADGDETVKYTIDGAEQTSPTIQGTVTSGQWSDNIAVRQATTRYDLIQADDLTTTDMYDTSDIDNAVPLLVELTGDVQDNPLFIREAPFCWLLYNETLDATEEEKVEKYLGF